MNVHRRSPIGKTNKQNKRPALDAPITRRLNDEDRQRLTSAVPSNVAPGHRDSASMESDLAPVSIITSSALGGARMDEGLRDELVALDEYDQAVCAELAAGGSLFDGYHPRMASVHRANAARLAEVIDVHGWPGVGLVGESGAFAAWRIAQHSIGDPPLMRRCRGLLDEASRRGDAARWQFAFLDDRVRVYEGRPQRYGTQLRGGPDGLEPHPLEDPAGVEERRREVGLPPLAEVVAQARANPPPEPRDQAAKDAAELRWRRDVGWLV